MIKVAINGFGRIGRLALREILTTNDFDIVAINDLSKAEDLAYLLKYDTNHRTFHEDKITNTENEIIIDGKKKIPVFAEKDPENLPWRDLNVDLVLECTGFFTSEEGAMKHIKAGAKKVLISAPATDEVKTIVYNVNHHILNENDIIVSAASCTTNCLAPVVKIIHDNYGITKGFMSTVHAYTNDQATLDITHEKGYKSRRGRACAMNIIPSSTGAAKAIGRVIPELEGRLEGLAYRVPVSDGSVVDMALEIKSNVTKEIVNQLFMDNMNETIHLTFDPVVSSDIIGSKLGSLIDGNLTNVLEVEGKQLLKVVAWYDNEMGYTAQMMRTARVMFK